MPEVPLISATGRLISLRCSPELREWGGPNAILNIGISARTLPALEKLVGKVNALELFRRLVPTYAHAVHSVDTEGFEQLVQRHLRTEGAKRDPDALAGLVEAMLQFFEEEAEVAFPLDPRDQLEGAARAMARSWNSPSARILRQAKGAPANAGLGLIVQDLALALAPGGERGRGPCRSWTARPERPPALGASCRTRSVQLAQPGARRPRKLTTMARIEARDQDPSLEEICPKALDSLKKLADRAAMGLGDAVQLEFIIENGAVSIIDAVPAAAMAAPRCGSQWIWPTAARLHIPRPCSGSSRAI